MSTFSIFLILIVIVAFLLVVVIMVQNPKGGGLSSSFGGGGTQQLGGVKKTTDFLDKSTWALATLLIVLILLSNISIPGAGGIQESKALDNDATSTQELPATNTDTEALPFNEAAQDSAQ
ncbi:MAG: preprotein translocase subunit SecG [Flavobacteriaceae bacterium]|nr:MAG: preprotein translocase subunit SecG [Flavobacteriaceae bacterium]